MSELVAALVVLALAGNPGDPQTADSKSGDPKRQLTAQETRAQRCNADAAGKKFTDEKERQAFMRECLKR